MLQSLRRYLLQQLKDLIPASGETLAESAVVRASALIRLYSALKGIATLKYVCPLSAVGGWRLELFSCRVFEQDFCINCLG